MRAAQVDAKDVTVAMSKLSKLRAWREAVVLLDAMPEASVQSNVISFTASFGALTKQWHYVMALFRGMPVAQVQANVISVNAITGTCAKALQWKQALAFFAMMPGAGLEPDIHSCSSASCTVQWQQALACFHKFPADIISFNSTISSCAQEAWHQALALSRAMPQLKASEVTMGATISAWESGDQWQQALLAMSSFSRVRVSAISLNGAIMACKRGIQWQQAVGLLDTQVAA